MTEPTATPDGPARSGDDGTPDDSSTPDAVQFGRPEMSLWMRWWPVPFLVVWYGGLWITGNLGGHGLPRIFPVVMIVSTYWIYRDLDRSARIEPDVVTLRTARRIERVAAHEVTGIRLEKTPGWFSHSVYVAIQRGRFDSFPLQNVKAKDTPEGRAPLQAKVDAALAVLHAGEIGDDDGQRGGDRSTTASDTP